MTKLVNESIDAFIFEAKDDESHGMISGAWKSFKTAPKRALRRSRARKIMQKYKNKIITKVDSIIEKYVKNIDALINKAKNRIEFINASGGVEEVKADQMQDLVDDVKDTFQGILKTIRSTIEEQIKVFADGLGNRLERKGTVTGVEFSPEDKTNLLSEWKSVEGELNYYVETKMLDLLDNIKISQLAELKAEMKDFIEKQKPFSYRIRTKDESSDETTVRDSVQRKVLNYVTSAGAAFDTTYAITNKATFPNNIGETFFQFKIENGKIGYAFYELASKGGIKKYIRSSSNPEFYALQREADSPDQYKTRYSIINKSSTIK